MSRRRHTGFVLLAIVASCGGGSQERGSRDPRGPSDIPAPIQVRAPRADKPTAPAAPAAACVLSTQMVRLRIDAGQTLPTGSGLSVTYVGASHDNYGPGDTDLLISLRFRRGEQVEEQLPSFRDRRTSKVLGHCYRLVDASEGAVLIDVSPLDQPEPGSEPTGTLVGAGAPPPDASACTVTDDNGPLPGGSSTTKGCASDEICVCEAQAGYSCSGRCAPAQKR